MALITLIFAGLLIGASTNTAKPLPEQYVEALKSYLGASYAPAGEPGGISYSALIRQALLDTTVDRETRSAVQTNQCLSGELLRGCGGKLSVVQAAKNLHDVDYTLMQPGDLAILGDGIHTMAYLENRQWIHSDQIEGKVVTVEEPLGRGGWFFYQVTVMRWNALSTNLPSK